MTLIVQKLEWTVLTATLANIAAFVVCHLAARRYVDAPMPRVELRFIDILLRAALVAALVALVVGLSFTIGAAATGILAAFPVVFTSIMLILHRRLGAAATAAVIAHSFAGLLGFGVSLIALHVVVVPLGKAGGLVLALAVAMAWNGALFAAKRFAAA